MNGDICVKGSLLSAYLKTEIKFNISLLRQNITSCSIDIYPFRHVITIFPTNNLLLSNVRLRLD